MRVNYLRKTFENLHRASPSQIYIKDGVDGGSFGRSLLIPRQFLHEQKRLSFASGSAFGGRLSRGRHDMQRVRPRRWRPRHRRRLRVEILFRQRQEQQGILVNHDFDSLCIDLHCIDRQLVSMTFAHSFRPRITLASEAQKIPC